MNSINKKKKRQQLFSKAFFYFFSFQVIHKVSKGIREITFTFPLSLKIPSQAHNSSTKRLFEIGKTRCISLPPIKKPQALLASALRHIFSNKMDLGPPLLTSKTKQIGSGKR